VVLGFLLMVALIIRLAVLPATGHSGDVSVMARWAENLAQFGPWFFYQHDGAIYPALLPFLWPIGLLLDDVALTLVIKGLSIPFDLLLGVLLFAVVASRTDPARGLLAAGLYLLNPAAIIGGPWWGQVDAAGTLLFVGALVALAADRFAVAGGAAILAGLAKPQFGLVALPVAVVTIQRWRRGDGPRALGLAAVGGAVTGLAIGLFAGLTPWRWLELLRGAAEFQPATSLGAFNIWALLVGFGVPDDPYVTIGAVLLVAGVVGALLPLRRGSDLATLLAVGLCLAFAFYFLPTRVHERYLFPALALAAPFAAVHLPSLVAYLGLSIGFALSLLRVLVLTAGLEIAPWFDEALTAEATVWILGAVLIGSAVALVWLTLRGAGAPLVERAAVSAAPG
jgi:Gpi18-like mannosyltransferase